MRLLAVARDERHGRAVREKPCDSRCLASPDADFRSDAGENSCVFHRVSIIPFLPPAGPLAPYDPAQLRKRVRLGEEHVVGMTAEHLANLVLR